MRFEPRARQISRFRPMPVISRYQIPRGGLQVSSAFADAIIAKYAASEGLDLPAASFVYPEMASDAGETMDRLASQLITLNRIRVQMNVYNQRWLQQYALSLSSSSQMLLRQLNIYSSATFGLSSQASVRELEYVLCELSGSIRRREGAAQETSLTQQSEREQEQEEIVLRILTAASRGNGTRERYMSELYRRLQESGRETREGRLELLDRAGAELLLLKAPGLATASMMSGWASEAARRFFWRVQRAPEQERKVLLQAGGYGTVVSLERALKSMNDAEFRRFSVELVERMQQVSELQNASEADWSDERFSGIEQQIEQISPEEWTALTGLLEKEGYFWADDGIVTLSGEDVPMLASEQARQLFWRIQRAPEQERQFFLEAGGFSSMESLEKALKTMDDVTFRRFSSQILERLHSFAADSGQPAAISAEKLFGGIRSADAQSPNSTQGQDSDAGDRLRTQKQVLLRQLYGGGETARVLEKSLRTVVEQRQVLTENAQIFNELSESVLNMTLDDWRNFRTEITSRNEFDIPGGADFSFLQTGDSVITEGPYTSEVQEADISFPQTKRAENVKETVHNSSNEKHTKGTAEGLRIEEGIRMSREKTELIRELRTLSRMPDSSIRTVQRFLREHTILREFGPEEGQHYYRQLTAAERENWQTFISDLLAVPEGSGSASIPTEQVFYRIHTGSGGELLTLFKGDGSGRDTALNAIERMREERVYAGELLTQGQGTTEDSPDTVSYLLQEMITPAMRDAARERSNPMAANSLIKTNSRTAGDARGTANSPNGGPDMELVPARMEVPRRAEAAQQEDKAMRRSEAETRSAAAYQDIEFETTSYHTEEHTAYETADRLGDVMHRLDQQQREIERLRSTQQRLAEHNVSREILKKLDARVQMERLRGGR